jgi:hypothetical protein
MKAKPVRKRTIMGNVFSSPRLTLARARHHILNFGKIVNEFVDSKPWTEFVDKDTDVSRDLYKLKFTQALPEMLPCVLFDAANNLRAVLDQAGYASAVAAKSPSLKATKFPFGPTESDFKNNLAGGCKDLRPEIRAIFESSNAYKTGDSTLWALNEIANNKKHCALKPLIIDSPSAFFSGKSVGMEGIDEIVSPGGAGIGWDSEKNEITLMAAPAGTNFRLGVSNVTFNIAIDDIDTLGNQSAVRVLDTMADKVGRILLATEAECRRLEISP